MTQTETIMLVALGFVVTSLIALFITRAIYVSAARFSKRRILARAPGAVADLRAERDRLRAELAMLARNAEMRDRGLTARLAEQAAQISRNRNRIELLLAEIEMRDDGIRTRDEQLQTADLEMASLQEEIAGRDAELASLERELRKRTDECVQLRAMGEKLSVALKEQAELSGRKAAQRGKFSARLESFLSDSSPETAKSRQSIEALLESSRHLTGTGDEDGRADGRRRKGRQRLGAASGPAGERALSARPEQVAQAHGDDAAAEDDEVASSSGSTGGLHNVISLASRLRSSQKKAERT